MPKILRLHEFGGPENLRLDEIPTAEPGPGEARIRVLACSVTLFQLIYFSSSLGGPRPELPTRFGYGAAGVVEAVGEGVPDSWLGQTVVPVGPFDQARYGCAGEEAIVPADRLVALPENLSPVQGAALWTPYLTAYALIHLAHVREGDYVALPAASSTVGLAAIQVCRDRGALPIAVTRSQAKAQALSEAGAHAVVHTDTQNYVDEIDRITGGAGARIAFDPVGGDFLTDAAAATAPGGMIIEYGALGGLKGRFPIEHVLGRGLTIRGWSVRELVDDPDVRERAVEHVLRRVERGVYVPRVAATFPLADAAAAFGHVAAGAGMGQTVLVNAHRAA